MGGDRRIIILFLLAGFFVGQKVLAAPGHLVISQVQITGGPGRTAEDFVEIFNPLISESVDLEGYRLVKRTANGTSDTTLKAWSSSTLLEAGHYYIWGNSSVASVTPDVTTNGTIADDNAVALRQGAENTGEIIDAVGWGKAANALVEGAPFPINPAAGQTLQRLGEDTNNNAGDFIMAPVVLRQTPPSLPLLSGGNVTPPYQGGVGGGLLPQGDGDKSKVSAKETSLVNTAIKLALKDIREPVKQSQSKIFLSEVTFPGSVILGLDPGIHGFVEIENHGGTPVVLTDWLIKVDGKIVYRFDPDGFEAPTIGPRDFRIITKKTWQSWPAGAKVQLINADGKIIDETKYEQAEPDLSWTRFDDEWQWSVLPTPGKPNVVQLHEACNMEHVTQDGNCHSGAPQCCGAIESRNKEVDPIVEFTPHKVAGLQDDTPPLPVRPWRNGGDKGEGGLLLFTDEILSPADLTDELIGQRFVLRGEVSRKTVFGFWLSEDNDKIYIPFKEAPVEKGQPVKLLGLLQEKSGRLRFEPEGAVVVESKLSKLSKLSEVSKLSETSKSVLSHPELVSGSTTTKETNSPQPSLTLREGEKEKLPQEDVPWPKVAAGTAGLALVWRALRFFKER